MRKLKIKIARSNVTPSLNQQKVDLYWRTFDDSEGELGDRKQFKIYRFLMT